ncbi:MAG: DMT family transporter [Hyphomicrobiaceae bacterium]
MNILARVFRDAPSAQQSNVKGITFMIIACASFACGDTIMKLSSARVPTSELIFLRGCFVTTASFLLAASLGALAMLPRALNWTMAARASGDATGAWGFQMALARVPYADLAAISQLVPLSITAASALFLGEKVGWRRWLATAAGLLGVLLIIRPGTDAVNWWALGGIISVFGATLRDLATRRVDRGIPPPVIMFLSASFVTLTALAVAPFSTWQWPQASIVLAMSAAAVFSLCGQMCVIISVRAGELSSVAPFRYAIIVFAIISGFFVFGHSPDLVTLMGMAVVASAGLYTFYREQALRRRSRLPA